MKMFLIKIALVLIISLPFALLNITGVRLDIWVFESSCSNLNTQMSSLTRNIILALS